MNSIKSRLRDSEDEYTRISHNVDIMIYQIEPIVELVTFGGFNKNLCGTDARVTSCDAKCGGIFCDHCGGENCQVSVQ